MSMNRLLLIGCSKTKNSLEFNSRNAGRVTPRQLYSSPLFLKRVEYAESRGLRWYVLSAKYGIWRPTTELKPYDLTFSDLTAAETAAWHIGVAARVVEELWEPFHVNEAVEPLKPSEFTVEIHAGKEYCHPLAELLCALGIHVELPLKGLGIGEQLSWYGRQERLDSTRELVGYSQT